MVTKAQKFRLGIFVFVFSILMIGFIAMIAGRQIMEKKDNYHIVYSEISISGLQVGGTVKYHGISIGRIDDIIIDKENVQNVIVYISIDSGTPIKEDVVASLLPVGITGLLQVELSGGTNESALLSPGSQIIAGTSTFDSISGQAEIIVEKLTKVLDNIAEITSSTNQKKISGILTNVDSILSDNKEPFEHIMTSLDSTTFYLSQISRSSSEAIERLNEIVRSQQFNNIINNTEKITQDIAASDLRKLIEDLNNAILEVDETFSHIDQTHLKTRQDLIQSIETLRETLEYLNEFSRLISEEPSLLIRSKRK